MLSRTRSSATRSIRPEGRGLAIRTDRHNGLRELPRRSPRPSVASSSRSARSELELTAWRRSSRLLACRNHTSAKELGTSPADPRPCANPSCGLRPPPVARTSENSAGSPLAQPSPASHRRHLSEPSNAQPARSAAPYSPAHLASQNPSRSTSLQLRANLTPMILALTVQPRVVALPGASPRPLRPFEHVE